MYINYTAKAIQVTKFIQKLSSVAMADLGVQSPLSMTP